MQKAMNRKWPKEACTQINAHKHTNKTFKQK